MNLFEVLSRDLDADEPVDYKSNHFEHISSMKKMVLDGSVLSEKSFTTTTKPILQLNAFPVTLNPDLYANAYSTDNPHGSYTSLWAFRELVDPIPSFSKYYTPSTASTESTYSNILKGASAVGKSNFTAQVIASALKTLEDNSLSDMNGTPGTWCPINATPSDWYQTDNGRYRKINFDLTKAGDPDSPFAVIGGKDSTANQLKFISSDDKVEKKQLDSKSKVNNISMKYLQVSLSRDWYSDILFRISGWKLSGQDKGFCSSGNLKENNGVFPIIPSSIILGCEVRVDADWSNSDKKRIEVSLKKGEQISLDNLVIHPKDGMSDLQLIGWVTSLIPFSPIES